MNVLSFASKRVISVTSLAVILSSFSLAQQISVSPQATPRPLITQPVDEAQLTVLKGNTYPLARPQFDLGSAPATLPMQRMLLVLKRSAEQESALRKLLDDQQDKHSPNYHKWLTPEQFGKEFGPTDADMQTITSWLQSHGFQVGTSKGRTVLEFSGSASQVKEAFHTTIHKYIVNGEQHWANASDPSIPTALTPGVAGVDSIHNFDRQPMSEFFGILTRDKATGRITTPTKPDFTYPITTTNGCNAQDNNCYSVGPYDFAAIYNMTPQWSAGIDGTGERIAIVQETNINVADAHAFRVMFGLPTNDPNVILNGPDPGIVLPGVFGIESEGDLDVEWSGAVAKGASVDLVVSATTNSTSGIDLSSLYIVENNLDGIVSESFGICEPDLGTAGNQFYAAVWEQAAAQGMSVFVSAGDQGSAVCDGFQGTAPQPAVSGLAVNGIASTPFNVAVGGTDFQDVSDPETFWNLTNEANQASVKGYIPETTWNDTCTNALFAQSKGGSTNAETNCNNAAFVDFVTTMAGSGGASAFYAKPSWQTGTGVPSDGFRDLPDVSLFASNGFQGNSYVFCEGDLTPSGSCDLSAPYTNFGGVGGTSASAPAMAGIMALINQKTGTRQGNPNYIFYKLAAQTPAASCNSTTGPGSSCIFNDVTNGTIRVPCAKGSLDCTTSIATDQYGIINGYDTGVGYDLATGLGSVNISNLVNQWNSVTFIATTTTLAPFPTSFPHGTSVNVSVTVAPTSGTGNPSGDVSLIADVSSTITNSLGFVTLSPAGASASSATSPTTELPGGTNYPVHAHYAGDATYAPSDSAPVSVTVTAEGSTTSLSEFTQDSNGNPVALANGAPLPFGSPVFVRADVVGLSGQGVPTGQVTFIDSFGSLPGQIPGFGPVSKTDSLNSQGSTSIGTGVGNFIGIFNYDAGNHSISASYAGDNSFNASSSTQPVTFSIQPGFTGVAGLANVTVATPGKSGTTTLGIIASTGFTPSVTVTCSGSTGSLPTGVNCSATTITPTGPNKIATGTITVTTTAAPAATLQRKAPYYFAAILGGLPLAGIVLLGPPKRRTWNAVGLLMLALLVGLPACGGGGSSHTTPPPPTPVTPTPAGTYTINVTATAGSLSQQEGSFTLTVQ